MKMKGKKMNLVIDKITNVGCCELLWYFLGVEGCRSALLMITKEEQGSSWHGTQLYIKEKKKCNHH